MAEIYVDGCGQSVVVHDPSVCEGEHCVVHNPSNHHMKDWPTLWRGDRQLMERICPHGIGHPDPDHLAFIAKIDGPDEARTESIHGCDGCCYDQRDEREP